MVTTTEIGAPNSNVQFDSGAYISDAHFSHGGAPDAGSQHYEHQTRRKSIVWKYFTVETVVGANFPRAICNKCKQSFVLISSSNNCAGTSHLKRHLSSHIPQKSIRVGWKKQPATKFIRKNEPASSSIGVLFESKEGQQDTVNKLKSEVETEGSVIYFQQKNPGSTPKSNLFTDQEEAYSFSIAKMIIQHDYPLDIVENPMFNNFASALQPRFKIRNINVIEEQIARLYLTEKQNIFKILAEIPGRVSLALDLWSSDQSFGYLFLTGQFLNRDWKLQRRILSVIKLPFPDSEIALNHAVSCCITDWGLDNNLFSLTFNDTFSNEIVKENLRCLLSIKNPRILNGQLIIGSCYARALSRVAREALIGSAVVEKVRKNVKYVLTSKTNYVKFDELRRKLQVSSTRDMEIDDQTKWNTTYEMLVTAFEFKEVYLNIYTLFPDYEETVSIEEWRQIETLIMYLKILHNGSTISQDGANPTADLFFHEAWRIQIELMNGASSQGHFVSNLTKPLKDIFDTYWKNCSVILALAVVMDPRFKMKYIESCFYKMYGDDADTWIKAINEGLHELFLEYFGESLPPPPTPFSDKIVKTDMVVDFLDFDFYIAKIMGGPYLKTELDKYLEEPVLVHVDGFDVLDWWRLNQFKYPTLSKMALDLLCIPVSSVDKDSGFDMIIERKMDRRRSCLRLSTLEALICTKDWLDFD